MAPGHNRGDLALPKGEEHKEIALLTIGKR